MAGRLLLVALVPVGLLLVLTVSGRAAATAHLEGMAKGARRRSVVATALTALAGMAATIWALRRVEARPPLGADMVEVDRAAFWPSPWVQAEPGPLSDAAVA